MRRLAGILLALVVGCGESFKDEAEEHAYLSSLSNPTAAQWKRLRAIDEDRARRDREAEERIEKADAPGRRARDLAEANRMLAEARAKLKLGTKADDEAAFETLRRIVIDHPDTAASLKAAGELDGHGQFYPKRRQ